MEIEAEIVVGAADVPVVEGADVVDAVDAAAVEVAVGAMAAVTGDTVAAEAGTNFFSARGRRISRIKVTQIKLAQDERRAAINRSRLFVALVLRMSS